MSADPLATELRALGRSLEASAPPELVEAVMARVAAEPRLSWWSRRWRAVVGGIAAVVLVGALTPPVRAAVVQWLGAVAVWEVAGAPPGGVPAPPVAGGVALAEARSSVSFPVAVPGALGEPRSVEVSGDRQRVSMSWRDGSVRLDQVAGTLAPYFAKTVYDRVVFTSVRGGEALWLAGPHRLEVVGAGGRERVEPPRLAGSTLIWVAEGVTFRLEGVPTREEAVAIAESATPG
ncbi:hypothetical protein ACFPM7_20710 [Actinokineospora guangxiensis]|uniref:DUF4367 domain-containing protein n=1 Tax=Actinokineospora guangxiensis TaxID=1490288 RepID=A0ABW0ERS2_9PSEU